MALQTPSRPTGDVPTREQIAIADTWDLTTLYPTDTAWERDLARIPELLNAVTGHAGHLGDSPARLRLAIDDMMALHSTLERVRVYASLRKDEDTTNPDALSRNERSVAAAIEAGQALAFFEPELLALDAAAFDALRSAPDLEPYRHMLDDLARQRPHVRSLEVEQLLAQSADVSRGASDAFGALDNADLRFGLVTDEGGNEFELTKARHGLLLRSQDRATRQRSYETFTQSYLAHKHTLAAMHSASVRGDVFYARARNHATAREAALFSNNVPTSVYDTLIAAVRAAQPVFARYLDLRRKLLGIWTISRHTICSFHFRQNPRRATSTGQASMKSLAG